jgi:hypothetical protein
MVTNTPYCNVKLVQEPGKPHASNRLQRIPPSANLSQVINIVNNNFSAMTKGNYVENARQTVVTRIYNPQDSSQYVDVRQIVGIQFANPLTGQTVTFRR